MQHSARIVIVGGGPAGTGSILKAMKDGRFEEMVAGGLALIEASSTLIEGSITKYNVNSDTLSNVFLECLEGATGNYLDLKRLQDEIEAVRIFHGRSIPLPLLQPFLRKLGVLLLDYLTQHPQCTVFMNTRVTTLQQNNDQSICLICNNGAAIHARHVILATGATPAASESFASSTSLLPYRHKSITSDQLIAAAHDAFTEQQLAALPASPNVVILGGNHSAFSAADYLLRKNKWHFKAGAVSIWATRAPKLFFNSPEEARQHQYTDFTEHDICSLTNRVYRLAGLRMDGRTLYMNMRSGNSSAEKRVVLHVYNTNDALDTHLQAADLVVHAFGYDFNILPFTASNGNPVSIRNNKGHWVNDRCQLLDADGAAIPGLFAVGLGAGFIPSGKLGGEAGFTGQTNGLWYYQNATAELLLENILN